MHECPWCDGTWVNVDGLWQHIAPNMAFWAKHEITDEDGGVIVTPIKSLTPSELRAAETYMRRNQRSFVPPRPCRPEDTSWN